MLSIEVHIGALGILGKICGKSWLEKSEKELRVLLFVVFSNREFSHNFSNRLKLIHR